MTEHWLRTDEHEEAVSALESVAEWSGRLETKIDYWKWVVLAMHNATQGFMVLALRGSNGLLPLRDDIAKAWLTAYGEGGEYPTEKLDSFLNLYKKIKSEAMLFHADSKNSTPSGSQGGSIKKLNSLRDDFIHFLPTSWSLEVSGLPKICLDCLDAVEFLGWESGNVRWYEDKHRARARAALDTARLHLKAIEKAYTSNAA
ncbi:MAG: hypothetical protein M1541_06840 [Acidobacteria bacterium]|nr:hypothetical protein [Acidobacteriota bacterium]